MEKFNCNRCLCHTCKTLNSKFNDECKWYKCESCFPTEDDPCTQCSGYTS